MDTKEGYFLNIYHRNIDVKERITGQIEPSKSHGHLYLSLQATGKHEFFGKYPAEGN